MDSVTQKHLISPGHEKKEPLPEALNQLIWRILSQTSAGLSYDVALDTAFSSLRLSIPFDRMGVALLDDSDTVIRSSWVKSLVPIAHLRRDYSIPLAGSSLEKVIREKQPRILDDLEEYLRLHPSSHSTELILKDGMRSSLTLPLLANSKAIGVVFFSSCEPHIYEEKHIQYFTEVSSALGIMIEQARLRKFFDINRSRERMLAMILHDLRSPLGVIIGFLEMASNEEWFSSLDDSAKEIFNALRRNSDAMVDLISEFSEVVQTGLDHELTIEPTSVDLRKFLSDFSREAEVFAENKKMTFVSDFDRRMPAVAHFDPKRLRQVLLNLLTNAVKFSYPHTEIIFSVEVTPENLKFSMTDHGQGIPPQEISKLFQWMGRTSTRPTQSETSTGLGLAIVKKIVEAHQGEVGVKSQFHSGSCFYFSIPNLAGPQSVH